MQETQRWGFDPWVRKITWCRKWQPAPVVWPGKFHWQRSLVGLQRVRQDWTQHTHTINLKKKKKRSVGCEGQVPKQRRREGMKKVWGILSRGRSQEARVSGWWKSSEHCLEQNAFSLNILTLNLFHSFPTREISAFGKHQGKEFMPFIPCPHPLFPKAGGKSS